MALGKAKLLAPAADGGVLAGGEINDFGFDLLRRLSSTGNLCASPTSIALALAMVRPGANGLTATEIDKVLHRFGSTAQANETVALLQALQAATFYDDSEFDSADPSATPDHTGKQPVVELDVSNAVFSQNGMHLMPAYLDSLSSGFGAGVGLVDYRNNAEAARQTINKWANLRTKGRVPNILSPGDIDSTTRIALANAIYFKAIWMDQFEPSATKNLPFTRAVGTKVSVPTMVRESDYQYSAGSGYRAVQIPFIASASMMILVPDNMSSFVNGLSAAKLATIGSQASNYIVDLTLPKFSAESRVDLATVLKAMGMTTAFDPSAADLSGITTDEKLFLDKVIHQANIDVDENGTTASAVTVVGGRGGAGQPPPRVQFHIDKPFLYFIRENTTGTVLFMGRIDDPSAKS
jgi:serpin B